MDLPASSDTATEPQVASDQESPAAWGLFGTIAWSVLVAVVFLVVQAFVAVIYAVLTMGHLPRAKVEAALADLKFDGVFLSISTFATLLVCAPLVVGIVKLKRGSQLRDYLGLTAPRTRQLLLWSLITSGYCGLTGVILSLLHESKSSEFMLKTYSSTHPRWLIWVAIVVCAPVFEEIFFRGFLFKGLAASRLRWYGATVVTSVLWAAVHVQYDWYEISAIFALGLVLGAARAMTNSTLLTIWLHCFVNVLATVGLAFEVK